MMPRTKSENGSETWKKFLRKHWGMLALFVVGAILLTIGAVLVFLGFAGAAQSTGLVPTTLGLWSMGHLVTFLLNLIFWEALFIGIPVILAAVAGWQWLKRLPDKEKKEYHFSGRRGRAARRGGGPIPLLVFIVFCIKVFADGNWNAAFGTWTFDYLIYSMLTVCIWVLIVFGIPAGLALIWWIRHDKKKKSSA